MIKNSYVPIIKMADAELRGVEYLTDQIKDKITPLFELTRSRKTKKNLERDINLRLAKLEKVFGKREFILDLTSDPNLTNDQIEQLQSNENGYHAWTEFLVNLQTTFPKIIPIIQISDEDVDTEEEMYKRVMVQLTELNKKFDKIVYRFKIDYTSFEADLKVITECIHNSKLIFLIDSEYILQNKAVIYKKRVLQILNKIQRFKPGLIIISATSFPRNPAEYGEETAILKLEERILYDLVIKDAPRMNICYSDYATLNPIILERAGGNGWVPRIDMPTLEEIFFYRTRKSGVDTTYINAYVKVAKLVVKDKKYSISKKKIKQCWGITQIESAASGSPQGLSPSFWISVRMNIHITLQSS